jgi:7,8-dihydropterin-6-yl-methyl-4-(beta-D-ribofuranosyl)aminobenzene 5'-phosphate synthase
MGTRVTIVVDDKAGGPLVSEHGLSLWIESGGKRILFDTGQGAALVANAQALGIDLSSTDILVLSHGHYDHTGGIPHVVDEAPHVEVYCHPGIFQPRYAIREEKARSIGMKRESIDALRALGDSRLHRVEDPLMLTESIGLTGPVPRLTDYEDTGGPFFLDVEGSRPDAIVDDLALFIETNAGTVACLGCAHAGVINTLTQVRALTGGTGIRAAIGGFHLLSAGPNRLEATAAALRTLQPDLLAPCHCTGDSAVAFLQEALGGRVSIGTAGVTYSF